MPSWRDETPQPVQDDLDNIVSAALDAAEHMLAKRGEFFPFGMMLSAEGALSLAAADPSLGEQPDSTAVLGVLYEGARQERDRLRGAGFVADVRADGSDAVRVEVEHRDGGPALVIVMPYGRKGLVKKSVAFGQMWLTPGDRKVW